MKLIISDVGITQECVDRINGLVCTNGSAVRYLPEQDIQDRLILEFDGRSNLTPQEIATFVRNYLEEGFDAEITIR